MALVAGSGWIGTQPPELDNPQLRDVLVLSHHYWNGDLRVGWVVGPPPSDFLFMGTVPPTAEDLLLDSIGICGWVSFPMQAFMQWRWEHDRDAMLQEDAEEEAAREAEAAMQEQKRRNRLAMAERRQTNRL